MAQRHGIFLHGAAEDSVPGKLPVLVCRCRCISAWTRTPLVAAMAVVALSLPGCIGARAPVADIVFKNAKIYTVDQSRPWAAAMALKDGRIAALGDEGDMRAWLGASTRVVDLQGRLVLPGFGDAHVHPEYGGLAYSRCSMHDGESIADYIEIIKTCVAQTDPGRWVFGIGWKPGLFPPEGIPDKTLLDDIAADRPLVFRSTGGHSLWLNSRALALAGITRDTPDPPYGRIDRDPQTGELLGGLQETAVDLVLPYLPPPTPQQVRGALLYAFDHLNQMGITNILDAGVGAGTSGPAMALDAYKTLAAARQLTVKASLAIMWDKGAGLEQIPAIIATVKELQGPGMNSHTVKIWLDGVIAQRTAALLEPYSDLQTVRGVPTLTQARLNEAVARFDGAGLQVMIHAIGDRAIRMSLDAFEYARERNGNSGNLHQITHAEFITPADIGRFAELDVLANLQPLWATMDPYMRMTVGRVGPWRMRSVYPANSLVAAGGSIVYGSDWPVASANPLRGLEVAVTRRTPGKPGAEALLAREGVTLAEAVEAYTLTVARVNGNADRTGSLSVGKDADLVVVDKNIFSLPVHEIATAKVLLTLLAGKPVYGSLDKL